MQAEPSGGDPDTFSVFVGPASHVLFHEARAPPSVPAWTIIAS
jgi:hypothetical protein